MLVAGNYSPCYSPTGHIVFHKENSLWAVPFDADRLEVTGSPTPVLEGVEVSIYLASFALGDDGSLVYVPDTAATPARKLVSVDRQGVEQPLADTLREYSQPRLSPNGRRLAVQIAGLDSRMDVWVLELARGGSSEARRNAVQILGRSSQVERVAPVLVELFEDAVRNSAVTPAGRPISTEPAARIQSGTVIVAGDSWG